MQRKREERLSLSVCLGQYLPVHGFLCRWGWETCGEVCGSGVQSAVVAGGEERRRKSRNKLGASPETELGWRPNEGVLAGKKNQICEKSQSK